jgi:ferric-dicitrate binding protein FerR (iron transport regulator)
VDYNTLSNPRGSKVISLTLSDGTRVWLNAGSSLRYPASFASSAVNREVKITGEAYFEVAHDASKPFIVSKNDVSVTVLGTHFNVNAYDDESDIKITLLEGSVRVNKGSNTGLLKPGQQAQVSSSVKVLNNTDVEQVMAWKNGKFSFNGSDIKTVMRELARWYDVNVEYKDEIKETFFVKLDRNTNMSNVFRILQTTGAVHFKIEGKKVTVMQ